MRSFLQSIVILTLGIGLAFTASGCFKAKSGENQASSALASTRSYVYTWDGWECTEESEDPQIDFITADDPAVQELLNVCNHSQVDITALKRILKTGVDLNQSYPIGRFWYTPLGLLSSRSHIDKEAVKLLVANGADINLYSKDGMTPLMMASSRHRIDKEAVRLFVELGADVNAGDESNNDSAAMLASDMACFDKEAVHLLLDLGADVNKVAKNGTTLLHGVIRDIDLTRRVIDMGASLYAQSYLGYNALDFAAWLGSPETVSFLIEKGLDPTRMRSNGFTNLSDAAVGNKLDVFILLENKVGNIHQLTINGTNLLSLACQRYDDLGVVRARHIQTDLVQYLIDKGLDVNQEDKYGFTPLMYAVLSPDDVTDVVKILLNAGANINHITKNGNTPLDLAENQNVIKLLIENGAVKNENDEENNTDDEDEEETDDEYDPETFENGFFDTYF